MTTEDQRGGSSPQDTSVTCVIPCFNHGRFVAEAVASCLAQRDADVRVVVVDDGSDDGSTPDACDAVAGERVRVIHQRNTGLPGARNRGAREADAEFLVFLDADDTIDPMFVAKLHGALRAAGDDASHAYCQEVLTGLGHGTWEVPDWDPDLLLITNLHPVTALVRTRCFREAAGFDESMKLGYEDWDLWLRFVERGWRGVRVREPLFTWRRHSHTTMVMDSVMRHEDLYAAIVAKHPVLYDHRLRELMVRTNALLRKFDMNWLDETGYPRELRYLWSVRDSYNNSSAIRAHAKLRAKVDAMPSPLRAAANRVLHWVKRWSKPK